jgi:hypothetical protein
MPDNAQEIFDALCAPFPTETIEWRIGSVTKDKSKGMALAYINARAVMDRLDAICGPGNWQDRYPHANTKTICEIGIKIHSDDGKSEWVWKSDGAGDTDFEAEKGAMSDAFKRAAVRWGIGRYLYELSAPWVSLENEGRKIPDTERKKLDEMHEKAASKYGWGHRQGVVAYKLLLSVVKETITQPSQVPPFLAKYSGMIAPLPVAMRRHLQQELDRIGGNQDEQEAA